jgi:hypothetical protein
MCSAHAITPKRGDILFIRTGLIVEWGTFTEQQKQDYATQKEPQHAGVAASLETLEWIWDWGIAAGDAISWEMYPTPAEVSMHEYLLAGWGRPISMWISITVRFSSFNQTWISLAESSFSGVFDDKMERFERNHH